jgi:hypothetical protein
VVTEPVARLAPRVALRCGFRLHETARREVFQCAVSGAASAGAALRPCAGRVPIRVLGRQVSPEAGRRVRNPAWCLRLVSGREKPVCAVVLVWMDALTAVTRSVARELSAWLAGVLELMCRCALRQAQVPVAARPRWFRRRLRAPRSEDSACSAQ